MGWRSVVNAGQHFARQGGYQTWKRGDFRCEWGGKVTWSI
ncbi:Uncharacterised protein [Vibrio cholerae]|nr:Uncharacterised protein [Vibrio cholerae]